jgi:uncharacterized protein (DUF1697 family)
LETFITLLRGINVGGQKKIQMTDLKILYESLGFTNVQAYIQSGNVIFKTTNGISSSEISRKIQEKIIEKFGFEVPVIIRTAEEIGNLLNQNPFLNDDYVDQEKLHVTFLKRIPEKADISKILETNWLPDKLVFVNKEIYLFCPIGYGTTKLSNTFFEKKLKLAATTRNWKTVLKLSELLELTKEIT